MPKIKGQPQTHKLFIRSATPPQGRRLQAGDIEIIKTIAEYHYLDSQQIGLLHPRNYKNLSMRLQWLFHAGFLDRPRAQVPPFGFRPRRHIIYSLARKGADVLLQHHPELAGHIKTTSKQPQELHLWHSMMITDFRVCLTLALQVHKQTKLTAWQKGKDVTLFVKADRGRKAMLIPDGFVTLEDPDYHWRYFLEADRGTMTLDRFLGKLKNYYHAKQDGTAERAIGSKQFRVLTIAKSEARAENLRQTAKRADQSKQGGNLFLFACEKQYTITNPQSILEPIWRSAKNDTPHYLLE